jgi:hypothetical protein
MQITEVHSTISIRIVTRYSSGNSSRSTISADGKREISDEMVERELKAFNRVLSDKGRINTPQHNG